MITAAEFSSKACYFPAGLVQSRSMPVLLWRHVSFLTSLRNKESSHKALNKIGHTALPITVDNICRLTTKVKLLLRVYAVSNLPMLRNGNETVTHPQLLRKGFAWAEVQLYSISTVGEALALPFFKVRFTKRKCLARFIQKKLLMVGRQKVLHTILPGAHVFQSPTF